MGDRPHLDHWPTHTHSGPVPFDPHLSLPKPLPTKNHKSPPLTPSLTDELFLLPDAFQWNLFVDLNELARTSSDSSTLQTLKEIITQIESNTPLSTNNTTIPALYAILINAPHPTHALSTLTTLLEQTNPTLRKQDLNTLFPPLSREPELPTTKILKHLKQLKLPT